MPIISAAASSRLFCKASAYNLAASSRNLPNKASRLSFSLAARCVRACACWVVHEVANDVRPPIADPASAAKADMYAACMRAAPVASSRLLLAFSSKTANACQAGAGRAWPGVADMRRINDTGDADGLNLLPRSDPGQQQQVWRADRTGAQDHLLGRVHHHGLAACRGADG